MEKDEILKEIYYNPKTGLNGAKQLYLQVKDKGISQKYVKEWLQRQEIHQIKTTKKKYYNAIIGGDNDYQMDLMFFNSLKKVNDGYDTIMNLVNITSRKAYSYPMKGKDQNEINRCFDLFYKDVNGKVENMTSDNEASFKNAINKYQHIKHWTVDVGDKAKTGIVERFNRTLRDKITIYMKLHKTKTWYKALPDLLTNYNNSIHSTIHITPNDFKSDDGHLIRLEAELRGKKALNETNNFKVGNKVRVLKIKDKFAKGSEKFSRENYEIVEIKQMSFILKNSKGVILQQKFKNWQLKKIDNVEAPQLKPIIEEKHSIKEIRKENKFNKLQNKDNITETLENKRLIPQNEKRTVKQTIKKDLGELKTESNLMKEGDRVSILFDNPKTWYDGTIKKIMKGGLVQIEYDDGELSNAKLLKGSENKTWKRLN